MRPSRRPRTVQLGRARHEGTLDPSRRLGVDCVRVEGESRGCGRTMIADRETDIEQTELLRAGRASPHRCDFSVGEDGLRCRAAGFRQFCAERLLDREDIEIVVILGGRDVAADVSELIAGCPRSGCPQRHSHLGREWPGE